MTAVGYPVPTIPSASVVMTRPPVVASPAGPADMDHLTPRSSTGSVDCSSAILSLPVVSTPDFSPAYGVQLHDPRLLEYVGAPESARLLTRSPEYWLHHMGREKTHSAALQLQHDAGLILSNVQVLQQLVTALNKT